MIILHKEHAIGIKKITEAELGRGNSNLTHIGLSEKVFTFVPNEGEEVDGIFMHDEGEPIAVQCAFSKINNARSTKITTTTRNPEKSVVKQIKNYAADPDRDWYLVWFALEDGTPVFWLLDNGAEDFPAIQSVVGNSLGALAFDSGKDQYYVILNAVRSSSKLNKYIDRKKQLTSKNILIATSKQHRTFARLSLDYFYAYDQFEKLKAFFSTNELNQPISINIDGTVKLPNIFIFADKDEIEERNKDRQRWYTIPFSSKDRQLYLYVDWYFDDNNASDNLNKLQIYQLVKAINKCYGDNYIYSYKDGSHELWQKNSTDWIFPSNESKFKLAAYFESHKQVDWSKGDEKCAVGDIVYFYCSGTNGRIRYKAKIINNEIPSPNHINDKEYWIDPKDYEAEENKEKKYIRLELLIGLAEDDMRLSLNRLHDLGVNGNMQGRMKVPNEALAEIEAVFNTPNTASVKETKSFQIVDAVNAVKETGLIYSDLLIKRFATSLLTKPFVILSGLAGSGKTQLAIAFAKAMVENEDEQLRVVSVGADWTNREPLLGYPNALKTGEYVHPESGALDILINANKNPDKPYFLILDEMNLSYVERYFADFLSAMESHQEIPLWKQDGNETPKSVKLPKNVFVIGTINVDETTYMFSPKVLDRANVIEFKVGEKDMDEFLTNAQSVDVDSASGVLSSEAVDFVKIASEKVVPSSIANDVLKNFFSQLKTVNAEFGYRTASEIGRFIGLAKQVAGMADDEAIDCAIVQKLLPKLHGSRKKIVPVLKELWSLCEAGDKIDEKTSMEVPKGTKYSLSADKILRMYQCAIDNGFTSFAEA